MDQQPFASTESVLAAIREVAEERGRAMAVTHDIGADRTSRRLAAGVGTVADADGSLPHEAFVELGDSPRVEIQLYSEGDATIDVDGVVFHDLPRADVPDFLRSVYGGAAHVSGRLFPPGWRLVVPLPGDRTYRELVQTPGLTPWLSSRVR
ncbi:hypothetical protein LRS74_16175 [Streptomyces sp. LX-29]|uniref:hypothetical protein n=1 Tax=Streptomyces sp. LX-29 TaxID=2900152 RepID=UPI00240D3FFB|nr:hypothetical protein [Streptomyces sp. LX-29]WFB08414.1 hypothetical protein LRS74_16175 [Streptomyces sp. LX-29]